MGVILVESDGDEQPEEKENERQEERLEIDLEIGEQRGMVAMETPAKCLKNPI